MRVIYDDNKAATVKQLLCEFMNSPDTSVHNFLEYDYGMDRIQTNILYKRINEYLNKRGFRIGRSAKHANGIGNNCAYAVYFDTPDEIQECCSIHINSGLHGEAWVYLTDYDGQKLGKSYKLSHMGII